DEGAELRLLRTLRHRYHFLCGSALGDSRSREVPPSQEREIRRQFALTDGAPLLGRILDLSDHLAHEGSSERVRKEARGHRDWALREQQPGRSSAARLRPQELALPAAPRTLPASD
ncbi:MAG TPA: hypothetical protein VFU47_05265, partial [Armatimonadota bacterium]|nr:hypothetical protein [Armatimonadota bacterium]